MDSALSGGGPVWLHRQGVPLWHAILGIDNIRYAEWPVVWQAARLHDGPKVLGVGAGGKSLFPLALACKYGTDVLAIDCTDPLAWLDAAYEKPGQKGLLKRAAADSGRL